jgi:hypothetical protein
MRDGNMGQLKFGEGVVEFASTESEPVQIAAQVHQARGEFGLAIAGTPNFTVTKTEFVEFEAAGDSVFGVPCYPSRVFSIRSDVNVVDAGLLIVFISLVNALRSCFCQKTMGRDFNIADIQLFINIALTRNLSEGAARSHLSRSAASIRIKNVEERLGVKLLIRTGTGVELSGAGQTFLSRGHLLIAQIDELTNSLQEFAHGTKGHLRICASTVSITEFLPPVMRNYLGWHPRVSVDLRERLSEDVMREIAEGASDLGIAADIAPAEMCRRFRTGTSS